MTYCEKTSDNEIALHATPDEMAFVLDLLNSIQHPTADILREKIEPIVHSNDRFQLEIERKIEICSKCKGEGEINVGNLFEGHNHDREECYRCDGAGRKIVVTTRRYENIIRQPAEL